MQTRKKINNDAFALAQQDAQARFDNPQRQKFSEQHFNAIRSKEKLEQSKVDFAQRAQDGHSKKWTEVNGTWIKAKDEDTQPVSSATTIIPFSGGSIAAPDDNIAVK